ncbi:MAG: hypothetical protein KDI51_15450, partial [Xanthomonadales bacterium]|nr:hypothetical protein [Xanthomonadales bacterium]
MAILVPPYLGRFVVAASRIGGLVELGARGFIERAMIAEFLLDPQQRFALLPTAFVGRNRQPLKTLTAGQRLQQPRPFILIGAQ